MTDTHSGNDRDDDVVWARVRTSETEVFARVRQTPGLTMRLKSNSHAYDIRPDGVLQQWTPFGSDQGVTELGEVVEFEFVGE